LQKEKLLSIGKCPIFSLAEVREKRDEAKRLPSNGVDPSEKKCSEKKRREKQSRILITWINLTGL
jgi:hypothetical protein